MVNNNSDQDGLFLEFPEGNFGEYFGCRLVIQVTDHLAKELCARHFLFGRSLRVERNYEMQL